MRGCRSQNGFTLIELMIVIGIMGMLFVFTIPAVNSFRRSSDMHYATTNIARQLLLAREKAISTGQTQQLRFIANFQGTSDYHVWNGTSQVVSWKLPKNITYSWSGGTNNSYRMTPDGRCMDSGLIILTDARNHADTVSVLTSGLVLVY